MARLSDVSSRFGAPMGRREYHATIRSHVGDRFTLRHVGLNSGGYDSGGAYWGGPDTLYVAEVSEPHLSDNCPDGMIRFFVRAPTREAAKQKVREAGYVSATFFR